MIDTIETSDEPTGTRMTVFPTILSGFATLGSLLVSMFYHETSLSFSAIIFTTMLISFVLNQMKERLVSE